MGQIIAHEPNLAENLEGGFLALRSIPHHIDNMRFRPLDKSHPGLPRGKAFRFTPFIYECSVTEWVKPGVFLLYLKQNIMLVLKRTASMRWHF